MGKIMNSILYIVENKLDSFEKNIISMDMFFKGENINPLDEIEEFFKRCSNEDIIIIGKPKAISGRYNFFNMARTFNKNIYFINAKNPGFDPYFMAKIGKDLERKFYRPSYIYDYLSKKSLEIIYFGIFSSLDYLKENRILGNVKEKPYLIRPPYYLISSDDKGCLYTYKTFKEEKEAYMEIMKIFEEKIKLFDKFYLGLNYKNDKIKRESEEVLKRQIGRSGLYKKNQLDKKGFDLDLTLCIL